MSALPEGQAYGAGRCQIKTGIWHLVSGICFLTGIWHLASGISYAVSVVKIDPPSGLAESTKKVIIHGSGFVADSTEVTLKKDATKIPDNNDVVVSTINAGKRLTCSFDLPATPGLYDLEVLVGTSSDTLKSCFVVNQSVTAPLVWYRTLVGGFSSYVWDVCVGDGNNDGELEVYASGSGGQVQQFKRSGTSWQAESLNSGGSDMKGIAVGDGDNDGEYEVYVACNDDKVYQFEYPGSLPWTKTEIQGDRVPERELTKVVVGDGDNDGKFEVYAIGEPEKVYQFEYNGSWSRSWVDEGEQSLYAVVVGEGNGKDKLMVYVGSHDWNIYQYEWSGTEWGEKKKVRWYKYDDPLKVPQDGQASCASYVYTLAIGDVNGDGKPDLCAGTGGNGYVYRFTYDPSFGAPTWSRRFLGNFNREVKSIACADGDNDGKPELYVGLADGEEVWRYKFDEEKNIWNRDKLARISEFQKPVNGVCVGDGDGDGKLEIYVACGDQNVYQLKAKHDDVRPNPIADFSASPGDWGGEVKIVWTAPKDNDTADVDIQPPCAKYILRYATNSILTQTDFNQAREYSQNWEPKGWHEESEIGPERPPEEEEHRLTGLVEGVTYYFAIVGEDAAGNQADLSNCATTYAQDIAPATIEDLQLWPGQWGGEIDLQWTAPGDDGNSGQIVPSELGSGYQIKYSSVGVINDTATWQEAAEYLPVPSPAPGGALESLTLTGLVEGATYWVAIVAWDEAENCGELSNPTSTYACSIPPAKIGDLTGLPGKENGEIQLFWTSPGDDGTVGNLSGRFRIDYSTISNYQFSISNYQLEISTSNISPGSDIWYLVSDLKPYATYYLEIWTADEVGNWSEGSDLVGVRARLWPPPDPENFSGVVLSTSSIRWQWQGLPTHTGAGYLILDGWRVINSAEETIIEDNLDPAATLFIEADLNPNTYCERYVQAYNTAGASSSTSTIKHTFCTPPTNLHSPEQTTTSITLTWEGDGTKYRLERSTGIDDFGLLIDDLEKMTYIDTGLKEKATYWYRVKAFNGDGVETDFSPVLSTRTAVTRPSKIEEVRDGEGADIVWVTTNTYLQANWDESQDPESGIARYWYAIVDDTAVVVDWTDVGLSTYVKRTGLNLTEGRVYYFTVKAENGVGYFSDPTSSDGQLVEISLPEGAPSAPQSQGQGLYVATTTITYSWEQNTLVDPQSGIVGYELEVRGPQSTVHSYEVGDVLEYSLSGCEDGVTYRARVRGINGVGWSSKWSDSSVVTIDITPPVRPQDIQGQSSLGENQIQSTDSLVFSATVSEDTTAYFIRIEDQDENLLTEGVGVNLQLAGSNLSGTINFEDLINNYPLITQVVVKIQVEDRAGNLSETAVLNFAIEPEDNRLICYDNIFDPHSGEKAIIRWELTQASEVEIRIYNLRGQLIREIKKQQSVGSFPWDGTNEEGDVVASGVYIVFMQAGKFETTQKIVVIK